MSVKTLEEEEAGRVAEVRAVMIERMTHAVIGGLAAHAIHAEIPTDAVDIATATVDLLIKRFPCLSQ